MSNSLLHSLVHRRRVTVLVSVSSVARQTSGLDVLANEFRSYLSVLLLLFANSEHFAL